MHGTIICKATRLFYLDNPSPARGGASPVARFIALSVPLSSLLVL